MQVLKLSNGATEIVGNARDFSHLLEKYLGIEVSGWFEGFVKDSGTIRENLQVKEQLNFDNDWK